MTNLKSTTYNKVVSKKLEETAAIGSTLPPKTVGGKDIRTNKMKKQDDHLLRYDVTMAKNFQSAQQAHEEE